MATVMVKITGSTPLCNYCFGYTDTLIRETWGKWWCKHMLKNTDKFICFLPKAGVWALWISYYRLLLKKFIMGCVREQVGWIGEEKMLASAGHYAKNCHREKLMFIQSAVFCADKLPVCRLLESMLVQVKWLKHSHLPSSASMNLKGLQLFLHALELRNSLGWVSSSPGLCSYNWKHWGTTCTDA